MSGLLQHFDFGSYLNTLFELESKAISPSHWNTSVPPYIRKIARKAWDIPHCIGQSEQFGWYIIGTAGQGPFVIYIEHKKEWDKFHDN